MTQVRPSLVPVLVVLALVAGCRAPAGPTAAAPAFEKRVEGRGGMVAASHPDAARAGAQILREGGNAIDAAVATAFSLSVVDVSQTGLGGGGALTWYDARAGTTEHLSFYPRSGADSAWGQADSSRGAAAGRAAAVPGMVAGLLEAHQRFGVLTRAQVLAPAIALARDGFIVSPLLARTIASSRAKLEADSVAAARFLPGGEPMRPGDRLVQPELTNTLLAIAAGGRDGFYRGAVAEQLASRVRARGGLITTSDLAAFPVATLRPLCTEWRGYTVLGAPPPMGGASVLEMLQLAEASGVADAGGFTDHPEAVTRLADIMRIAQADNSRWRGDPFVVGVPARGTASGEFARERAALVGAAPDTVRPGDPWPHDTASVPASCAALGAYPSASPPTVGSAARESGDDGTEPASASNTSHLAVVDAAGNAVSATTTVGVLFGSGVYAGGFFLNSSANNFDARTRGPNRYTNSTMSPTVVLEGGRVRLVVGAAGSQYIQPSITQVTLRMLAFGEDPWLAVAAPRIHASASQREVEVEPGFAPSVYQALVARGYRPLSRVADIQFGGVHAVYVSPKGTRIGVADPRRDGAAARP